MNVTIRYGNRRRRGAIKSIVYKAYKIYVPRIGKKLAPMTDDYHRQVLNRLARQSDYGFGRGLVRRSTSATPTPRHWHRHAQHFTDLRRGSGA